MTNMENKNIHHLTCIICPMGCQLEASIQDSSSSDSTLPGTTAPSITVTGNSCKRGEQYAFTELTNPMRTLTCTVAVTGGSRPLVSARTKGEIPKKMLLRAMQYVKRLEIKAPVKTGDVIVEDFLQTGVPLVAGEDIAKATAKK